jgi:hypothetical protein
MHMTTLYSLRTDGAANTLGYRITKFVDGEVESSYLCTMQECECPAGHRSTCRHRQMLPQLLAEGIVNTHWFWNFDLHRVVDFDGMLKSNFDAMNELATQRTYAEAAREGVAMTDPVVGEAQHVEAAPNLTATEIDGRNAAMPPMKDAITEAAVDRIYELATRKPWRRL